jgi:hypothetical protein
MTHKIQCAAHGEKDKAYVCSHLAQKAAGLGFNRDEPDDQSPYPDAWCNDCEIIRAAHNGWTEESEKLLKISLVCSVCYEQARIKNTRTAVTMEDLANLRWKCGRCDAWHSGPCLDFGFGAPLYWSDGPGRIRLPVLDSTKDNRPKSFLTPDFCTLDDQHFFVRGVIKLPILGTAQHLRWGVWGSLSRENFELVLKSEGLADRTTAPMFSWLSTRIPDYPDTLSLKMYARVQAPQLRPHFELQETDHPLSREYHHGIAPERVKEIMLRRLPEVR